MLVLLLPIVPHIDTLKHFPTEIWLTSSLWRAFSTEPVIAE